MNYGIVPLLLLLMVHVEGMQSFTRKPSEELDKFQTFESLNTRAQRNRVRKRQAEWKRGRMREWIQGRREQPVRHIYPRVQYKESSSPSSHHFPTGPCSFPRPGTHQFHIFCQSPYHQSSYLCDPSGLLSRTEVDILDHTVHNANLSACFCEKNCDGSGKASIGIVIVPMATIQSIQECDQVEYVLPNTYSSVAYLFALQLKDYWKHDCAADILLVFINSWGAENVRKPYLVPLFYNRLERLSGHSGPIALTSKDTVLTSLQNILRTTQRLMDQGYTEVNTSIPSWALYLAMGMVGVVCLAVYIANYVTTHGKANTKQKSSITAVVRNGRFRAGFGGGMMMNQPHPPIQRKSTMMFRSFNKSRYANNNNNSNRI